MNEIIRNGIKIKSIVKSGDLINNRNIAVIVDVPAGYEYGINPKNENELIYQSICPFLIIDRLNPIFAKESSAFTMCGLINMKRK